MKNCQPTKHIPKCTPLLIHFSLALSNSMKYTIPAMYQHRTDGLTISGEGVTNQ